MNLKKITVNAWIRHFEWPEVRPIMTMTQKSFADIFFIYPILPTFHQLFTHFFPRKPEVERSIRIFSSPTPFRGGIREIPSLFSHPPGGILGIILWAVVINHSAKNAISNFVKNDSFFTLLKGEKNELPSLRPYDALVPFRIITKERARFIITISRQRKKLLKLLK